MTQNNGMPDPSGQSINDIEEHSMNVVYNISSIVTYPVEILLRPWHGTTYFSAPTVFISAMMLIFVSALVTTATGLATMIPFAHVRGPVGMFGLGSFTELFFLAGFAHGIRRWRLMVNVHLEQCSSFEGPALFFFRFLPKGDSFWFCRLVWEPCFLFVLAFVLNHLLVIQSPLEVYLQIAAICLAMKSYVAWYRNWLYIRRLLDMRFNAPLLAKIMENTASQDEMAQVHMASLPDNLPADIRRDTIAHVARAFNYPEANAK